jgi:GxxExxY protein
MKNHTKKKQPPIPYNHPARQQLPLHMRLLLFLFFTMWTTHLKAELAKKPACLMETIRTCSEQIMSRHRSGCTEAMYQRLLQVELYHRNIPSLAEVDVFMMSGSVPIHAGRLDLEIDHRVILELKVAPKILPKHIQQLQKYVRARISTGMNVEGAAVVCWTDKDTVEFHEIPVRSSFFRVSLKHE